MQELRRDHPDWLEQREISFADGYAGHYVSDTLVISHRWEEVVNLTPACQRGHRVGLVRLLVNAAGQGQD